MRGGLVVGSGGGSGGRAPWQELVGGSSGGPCVGSCVRFYGGSVGGSGGGSCRGWLAGPVEGALGSPAGRVRRAGPGGGNALAMVEAEAQVYTEG